MTRPIGAQIVLTAAEAPLKQIAINAGLEGGVVAEKVRNLPAGEGLNAATGEYDDLIEAGIIDPAKVTRSALQNAASIAALFLTTEAVIADKPEKASPAPAAATAAWAAWTSESVSATAVNEGRSRTGPPFGCPWARPDAALRQPRARWSGSPADRFGPGPR